MERACFLATGGDHHLLIDQDGNAWGFGDNSRAQLGFEPYSSLWKMKKVPVSSVVAVYAGNYQSLLIDTDGSVWGCGDNGTCILGLQGLGNTIYSPTKVPNIPPIRTIFLGYTFSLLLDYDGQYWACGNCLELCSGQRITPITLAMRVQTLCMANPSWILDEEGNLWKAKSALTKNPAENFEVCTEKKFIAISQATFGSTHTLFLDDEQNVWSYGRNREGQCGVGKLADRIKQMEKIPSIPKIKEIHAGKSHSALLDVDGRIWTFGMYGGLGTGRYGVDAKRPVLIPVTQKFHTILCGAHATYGIDEEGNVWRSGSRNNIGVFEKDERFPLITLARKTSTKSARNTADS